MFPLPGPEALDCKDITVEPTLTQIPSFPEKSATKTFEVKESSRLTEAIKEAAEVVVTLIPSVRSDQDNVQTHTDEEISEACTKSSDTCEPTEEAGSTEAQSPDSEKRCKKKVNVINWFKKNVTIHLPKHHAVRKEKAAGDKLDETEHVEGTASDEAIQTEQTSEPDQAEDRPNDNPLNTTTEDAPTDDSSLETPVNTPQAVVAQ
ncbi:hypothetical protein EG68_07256 [Paragonimus skrjabini miyazakii]|uniref:Uncharacterized protein n=1 Tax=Paragonimus skrjabini miyazakii TaxID=59628 RepID=A0A8S9YLN6_9TREM|nr:hypothetical protein EG68_07256 [Paragonimus skrjabini miyazakii]